MSTIKTATLSNVAGDKSIAVDRVAQGTAAAWVNFNGTGTVAIRAAYNVSSITDNGSGDYTVNFTTAMPDANYSFTGMAQDSSTKMSISGNNSVAPTASALRVVTSSGNASTVQVDSTYVAVAIFR